MVEGKPIPAIFLYKEPSGSKYSYNIMDGKQRLESLILFVGSHREDRNIKQWKKYFFTARSRKDAHFSIDIDNNTHTFKQLADATVAEFTEYRIPTVEITLDEDSSLDEVINLFVDINQQGVAVKRFDIVKALVKDPLIKDVFDLIATKQHRKNDVYYKAKKSDFTAVLKTLSVINNIPDPISRVDRMWERLLEIVLFFRKKEHRKPVEILKSFISNPDVSSPRLNEGETRALRQSFSFLRTAYRESDLIKTRLATDQTHFYTMITTIMGDDLLKHYNNKDLVRKLVAFGRTIEGRRKSTGLSARTKEDIVNYQELSARQTTDVSRRKERQEILTRVIGEL